MLIGGYFDRWHDGWGEAEMDWFEALLEEQDVDIMAWAIGTAAVARALAGRDDEPPPGPRLHQASRMSDRPPENPDGDEADHAGRRAGRVHALARRRSRARRRRKGRAVFIAPDEAAMRALADAAALFRAGAGDADLPGLGLPALRPQLALAARDLRAAGDAARAAAQDRQAAAARHHGQRRDPADADAVPHPPARRPARARRADRPRPAGRPAPGQRLWPHRHGRAIPASSRCAAASSTCFPSGEEQALRLDFFGDEIESVRRFDPATQRSIDRIDGFTLLPASETLLDEDSVKRFRSALSRVVRRHRDRRSALPGGVGRPPHRRHRPLAALVRGAARDPVRPSRRRRSDRPRRRRRRRGRGAVRGDRRLLREPHARADQRIRAATARSRPRRSISSRDGMGRRSSPTRPLHLRHARSTSRRAPRCIDFDVDAPRDFAPERTQGANVYEAVVDHVADAAPRASTRSCSPAIRPARASG